MSYQLKTCTKKQLQKIVKKAYSGVAIKLPFLGKHIKRKRLERLYHMIIKEVDVAMLECLKKYFTTSGQLPGERFTVKHAEYLPRVKEDFIKINKDKIKK